MPIYTITNRSCSRLPALINALGLGEVPYQIPIRVHQEAYKLSLAQQ
jgi:hypothetical protein